MKRITALLLILTLILPVTAIAEDKEGIFVPSYSTFITRYLDELTKKFDKEKFGYKDEVISIIKKNFIQPKNSTGGKSHYTAADIRNITVSVFETNNYLSVMEFEVAYNYSSNELLKYKVGNKSFFDVMIECAIRALNPNWNANADVLEHLNYYSINPLEGTNMSVSCNIDVYKFTVNRSSGHFYFRINFEL